MRAVDRSGTTTYETLRSEPPLLFRPCGDELQLVGGAAGPLGGDRLRCELELGADSVVHVRTVAASVVLAGAEPSSAEIVACVGPNAELDWRAQPLVSTARSRHRQAVRIDLAAGAKLRWREDIVWGRSEEPGGLLSTGLRIERAGHAVLHQDLEMGDERAAWAGPGGLAGARSIATEVLIGLDVDPETQPVVDDDGAAIACELAPDAWLLQSVGRSHRRTAERLSQLRRGRD